MKKKLDVSAIAGNLRGESVFFPTKGTTPVPRKAGEPLENLPKEEKPSASIDVNMHTRTHAPNEVSQKSDLVESLHRKLQQKHHLSSYTFRFRFEELEELAKLDMKLDKTHPNKMSKNDLVRLGVNWLLEDYELNGETSVLARILARM